MAIILNWLKGIHTQNNCFLEKVINIGTILVKMFVLNAQPKYCHSK
jgi:hypothetical protein